jgi:hypothetical protein
MFFYLALTLMVIYTLVFFFIDLRDYVNIGGTFGEAMTNMQLPTNVSDVQKKGGDQLKKIIESRPNLKQAVELGKPDFMKGLSNSMPHLISAYTKSKPYLDKAQPHLESAYKKAERDIKKAQYHLTGAYNKAQPDIKNAFDNSFNDFNEAYQKSRPHLGAEVVELGSGMMQMGEKINGATSSPTQNPTAVMQNPTSVGQNPTTVIQNPTSVGQNPTAVMQNPTSVGQNPTAVMQNPTAVMQNPTSVGQNPAGVTENVMCPSKNNRLTHASQSAETPIATQQFNVNNPKFSRLSNGLIAKSGKGVCPNGCLAPQYDNDMCANEIFMGKSYRNCPWVSDGHIDNSACNDCGSILIPKNSHGYARTRPGLFSNKSLQMALNSCQLDKQSDNLDYEQIGMDFMDDLSRIKRFREPRLKDSEYNAIGRIVYKYDMDKINASLYKNRLTSVLNNVLNATELKNPVADRHAKYRRRRKCGQRERDPAKVKQLKTIMGDLKYQGAVDGAIDEMKSDNRLGGSKTSYTKNYQPIDPNKFPRPYDAIWSH